MDLKDTVTVFKIIGSQPIVSETNSLNQGLMVTRIENSSGRVSFQLAELWHFRTLIYFFIWRDVKIRYRQTLLGISWAIIQPFLTMFIFSLFLGKLAGVASDGVPYPLFCFAALVPWTFFGSALSLAPQCLVTNPDMIKRIYFPRMVMPMASILAGSIDLIPSFLLLMGLMGFYGFSPTCKALWIPAFVLLMFITSLGVGFWLSALAVQYRDVRYVVPFLLQAWFFATPIVYSDKILSSVWQPLYGLNPLVGVVEGVRWALLGTNTLHGPTLITSILSALGLLFSGAFYFRKKEKTFADVV